MLDSQFSVPVSSMNTDISCGPRGRKARMIVMEFFGRDKNKDNPFTCFAVCPSVGMPTETGQARASVPCSFEVTSQFCEGSL